MTQERRPDTDRPSPLRTWILQAATWVLVVVICAIGVAVGFIAYVIYYAQSLGPIGS